MTISNVRLMRRSDVDAFGCPFRYDRLVNKGVDDTGDEALRGRAVHAACYVYVLLLVRHQTPSDHELARTAFVEGLAVCPVPNHVVPECEALFFKWAERFQLDIDAYYSAEEVFAKQGGRRFQPDLLYARPQELEIIDFKTYYKALTEIQAKRELQLRWYLVEAMRAFPGFPAYRFTFDFIRLNHQVSLVFTPEEIEQFEPGIDGQIKAIERAREMNDYPPNPGQHCQLCRLECPAQEQPFKLPGRVLNYAKAVEVGGAILAKEAEIRQLKKIMGGFCQMEGPVHVNGQTFEYRSTTAMSYPGDIVISNVEEAGVQIKDCGFHFTDAALKKAKGLLPAAAVEDILAHAETRTTWALRHVKTGEDGKAVARKPDALADLTPEEDQG